MKRQKRGDAAISKQIIRINKMIRMFNRTRYGLTKHEIMDGLFDDDCGQYTERTFYRDIAVLREIGYDIEVSPDNRYVLENTAEIIGSALSIEEVQALQMCNALFGYFDGTHLRETIDAALNAVIAGQKTPFSKSDIRDVKDNFMVYLGWHRVFFDKRELIDNCVYAVNSRTVLNAKYREPNRKIEDIVLHPYRIVLYHDTLYLLCEHNDVLRLYHVSRFTEAQNTDAEFERNAELLAKYEENLSHSFGIHISGELKNVAVKFKKEVEYMLRERIWHQSQEITQDGDFVLLKLRVYVNGEFLAWVRSWGEAVVETAY